MSTYHLQQVFRPTTVAVVETLPRLPTGKLLKRVLRDRYEQTGHA